MPRRFKDLKVQDEETGGHAEWNVPTVSDTAPLTIYSAYCRVSPARGEVADGWRLAPIACQVAVFIQEWRLTVGSTTV